MADEVYDGAIGIDLGMSICALFPRELKRLTPLRHNLFVCCELRRQQCRNQYVRSSTNPGYCRLTRSVVANEQGNFTTPSFVSFTSEERLIGDAAKNQAAMNPENTIFDIK